MSRADFTSSKCRLWDFMGDQKPVLLPWEHGGLTRKVSSSLKCSGSGRGSLLLLAAGALIFLQPALWEEYFRVSNC